MIETKRLENESLKAYELRLCRGKSLSGLSWNEIAELVSEQGGTIVKGDTVRKRHTHYESGFVDGLAQNLSGDDVLREIESKTLALNKAKIKMQDQRRDYSSIVRNSARFEHVKDEILDAIKEIASKKPLTWNQQDTFLKIGEREAVLLVSDLHRGALPNDEFDKRMQTLAKKAVEYCKNHDVGVLHIFLIGDLVNGIIHVTTRIANTENVVKQTQNVSESLAESITYIANNLPVVCVYSVGGNHDRVTPNINDSLNGESFANFVIWYLKARLANVENVHFMENELNDEVIVAKVCGSTVVGVHGHKDKPENVVKDLCMMLKVFPDVVTLGHYHHSREDEYQGISVVVNPSFYGGGDEYAENIRKSSKAGQKLLIFEKNEGRLCTYDIKVDD